MTPKMKMTSKKKTTKIRDIFKKIKRIEFFIKIGWWVIRDLVFH